jgi:hypothetical protein
MLPARSECEAEFEPPALPTPTARDAYPSLTSCAARFNCRSKAAGSCFLVTATDSLAAVVQARLPSRFPERVIDSIAAGVKQQVQAFLATAPPASAE